MKQQVIKKRVFKESGIILAVLAVFGGVVWYLDSLSGDYEKENTTLSSEVSSISVQTNNLQTKYANAQKYSALYHEAMDRNAHDGLSINRDVIKDLFDRFKVRYHLLNLKLSMGSIQPMTDNKYKRDTRIIESSELSATLDAVSDEDVYGFLSALKTELPGAVKITQLSITRSGTVTDAVLQTIVKQGPQALVKAEIHFTWFGLKTVTPNEKTDASGKKN